MRPGTLINPFILHMLVEIPASINFMFFPSDQLRNMSTVDTAAHAVIRQYATLLFASCIIAFLFSPLANPMKITTLESRVAGALAIYHVAPLVRAASRLLGGENGEPVLHFGAHAVCFAMLVRRWVFGV